MSRVTGPAMVGNDFVLNAPSPTTRRSSYRETNFRRDYSAPNTLRQVPKSLTLLPNLFRQMLEATATYPAEQNISAKSELPLLNQASYTPDSKTYKRESRFSKSIIFATIATVIIASLTATGLVYKKQILAAVNDAKMAVAQKPVTPKPKPNEIAIHNSDYNQALTALMTQQVTVNLANSSQSVNPTTIANWLSIKESKKLTYISVKNSQVDSYLNHMVNGINGITAEQVSLAANKIADNLLKANGVTVKL